MTKELESDERGIFDKLADKIAKVSAIIVGIAVAWTTLYPLSPYLAFWLIWCIFLYSVIFIFKIYETKGKSKLRLISIIVLIGIGILMGSYQLINYNKAQKKHNIISEFEVKLRTLRWIAYEPISYDPDKKYYGTEKDITDELNLLYENEFNGVITFSSKGLLSRIPQIAKRIGFQGVIMGIIELTDDDEINAAIKASPYVDAYCVGHMFTDRPYTERDVHRAIQLICKMTNLPVSTTLRPNGYKAYTKIAEAIDWFFPDVHCDWYTEVNADKLLNQTKLHIKEISELQNLYPNKPILLKMISCPSDEVYNASPKEQYYFFRKVVKYVKSTMDFPERVYPSYFSAFDLPWKTPERGWPHGERFVGLFDKDKKAKRAVIEGKSIRVIDAFPWTRAEKFLKK
ncbi:MAG: hypothetical protein GTN82_14405 [Candidatus Aminicenantes bacterium]|nr:hypothetical protein [Candidatus Aminicenantes bacterium]